MAAPAQKTDTSKWYSPDPPDIKPDAKEVLEKYSKVPPEDIEAHVSRIVGSIPTLLLTALNSPPAQRDKAWAIFPYPCIGQWRFLDLAISQHSHYQEVLNRMRTGEQVYLDLGCAFAQDIRRLVADGVDSSQCYGADLRLDFIDLGYDLFRDKDSLNSKFIEADIFDPDSPLKQLDGEIDIIGASSFFHLFSWEEQKSAAHQVLKLMKPRGGSLLVGRQVGAREPAEKARGVQIGAGSRFRHNLESWQKFWKEVGDEAGVQLQVDGTDKDIPDAYKNILTFGDLVLEFAVRRL
ncbi:uncharacterized protein LTR77_004684 [Saxophila tyrrhenica]|uniref:Methyltransferase domain-containing protein n=1 Tax=Saxophila tyrrhenica TaxID=1690608 RepID=A0AAV9PDW7_9PEZI|nr:hypothetical protein LTR77_004684 [Saxophila tyrrhenica]